MRPGPRSRHPLMTSRPTRLRQRRLVGRADARPRRTPRIGLPLCGPAEPGQARIEAVRDRPARLARPGQRRRSGPAKRNKRKKNGRAPEPCDAPPPSAQCRTGRRRASAAQMRRGQHPAGLGAARCNPRLNNRPPRRSAEGSSPRLSRRPLRRTPEPASPRRNPRPPRRNGGRSGLRPSHHPPRPHAERNQLRRNHPRPNPRPPNRRAQSSVLPAPSSRRPQPSTPLQGGKAKGQPRPPPTQPPRRPLPRSRTPQQNDAIVPKPVVLARPARSPRAPRQARPRSRMDRVRTKPTAAGLRSRRPRRLSDRLPGRNHALARRGAGHASPD
jgi:hypothetical protein